ncbi:hypothetical protein [Parvibaculum sp.]|uniref:hypothetical protein n=1 Tax=Parvibaculum sp. TaxID=2024848 RepID=UPI001D945795|nr:hypothetical protein [Parvibaculum sp.]MBX3488719.1 hypothetical protein [Parvibaculum sp.]MCW5727399.1 hypothetical protein [Parvibaculum sp.]
MTDTSAAPDLKSSIDHWLVLFDDTFAEIELPLPKRPFETVMLLIESGAFELRVSNATVDLSNPWDHVAAPWFRILYAAAKEWYVDRYGAKAMESGGNPPICGVTLIRGAPFVLQVPMHRTQIVEEGRLAWMYFEAGIGEGENPVLWVVAPPNFELMEAAQRHTDIANLTLVSERLRKINFQLLGAGQDDVSAGFRFAIRNYLETAAQRMACGTANLGPAWFDLQMAIETALKLALHTVRNDYPRIHNIVDLFTRLSGDGVSFDLSKFDTWPEFSEMSGLRYAQGYSGSLADVFKAYLLALDAVIAALSVLLPVLGSGAGFLLKPAPWLVEKDA